MKPSGRNRKQKAKALFSVTASVAILLAALWPIINALPAYAFLENFAQGSDLSFSGAGSSFTTVSNITAAPDGNFASCTSGTGSGRYCQLWGTYSPTVAGMGFVHVYGFSFGGSSPVQLYLHDTTSSSYVLVSGSIGGGGTDQTIATPNPAHSYDQIIIEGDSGDTINVDAVSLSDVSGPGPTATPSSGGLLSSLISYWAMESTAATYGGEGLNTPCSIVTGNIGLVGNAQFMGNTSCLDGVDAGVVRINPIGDWTWAGWVHEESTDDNTFVISKMTNTSNVEMSLAWRTGGYYQFCWGTGTCITSTTPVNQYHWHFVAFGKSGSTAFIKVDNRDTDTATGTTGWQTVTDDLRWGAPIGYFGHGGGRDEWGLWASATGFGGALTDAQLSSLWNGGAGCTYPFSNCSDTTTPQPSPTPRNKDDAPNLLLNGSFEDQQGTAPNYNVQFLNYWDGAGFSTSQGINQNSNLFASSQGGPAECGSQYLNVNSAGMTQRTFLPGATPLYLSFYARRKLDDNGLSYARLEIDSTANGGVAGVDWTVLDGRNGATLGRSAANNGWNHFTVSHAFLVPNSAYYDVRISSVKFTPGGWYYDGHSNIWIPPSYVNQPDPAGDWQIDNIVLTTTGYGSYCSGPTNATVTPNATGTRAPTATTRATSTGTPYPTYTPTSSPTAGALVFANCSFENGSAGWTGTGFTIQLSGGPVGPQFLRVVGPGNYAQQPFDWGGGAAYFTFWVGPASGGSVQVVNVLGGVSDLWNFSESSPAWKQIRVTLPGLPAGHYELRVNGSSPNNMDVDGILPSVNGYAYCNSGTTQATPTSGPTSFVTPTPTNTPPSTLTLFAPTSTPGAPGATKTPNATWTATVTQGPATATITMSPSPTSANNATSTAVAATGTAFASITPSTATATQTGTPPTGTPSAMPNPTQQPEPAPNADCNRPDNPLNLAWWVDYEVCRVLTWFVWTPDNTQQMMNIQATLAVYEPMGTLSEIDNARNVAVAEVAQYDWANTGLQGTTGLPDIGILFPSTVPQGLLTGNLQLGPGAPDLFPFVTVCTLKTGAIFGDAMGAGLCATVNWLVSTGIMGWVQFLFDVAVWVAFMRYAWYLVVTKLPQIM